MGFFHLKRKPAEGNLPLAEWNQGAFPFQASPGHNFDTWAWPYPAQTNQYTYFNAFYGNQLPNFYVNIPRLEAPHQQVQRPWVGTKNPQQQNALQAGAPGSAPLLWGQQATADYISSLGNRWANGGGPRRKNWRQK